MNPLLNNITDLLIEEANAEEEELLGKGGDEDGVPRDQQLVKFDREDQFLKVIEIRVCVQ